MWRIENWDVLYDWLSHETDMARRLMMIEWMWELAQDPRACGFRIPGERAPMYLARTPVGSVTLKYLVADQYQTIRLVKFDQLP